jgi:cytoskeletal protein RodZ
MAAFGEELRRQRDARGVALDVMSAETKVQARYLEALEHGDFHKLPGGVFRRGILRAYLKALGLEEQEWLPRFDASVAENARAHGLSACQDEDAWVTFAYNVKKNRNHQKQTYGWRWAGVLAIALLLGAGGWAVWTFELRQLVQR